MRRVVFGFCAVFAAVTAAWGEPLRLYTMPGGVEVLLEDEFGAMLVNDGTEEAGIPRYILAIRATQTLVDTRDLSVFRAALRTLPAGAQVFKYDSCTVPRSFGLSNEQVATFRESFALARLWFRDDETRITCYCDGLTREGARPNAGAHPDSRMQWGWWQGDSRRLGMCRVAQVFEPAASPISQSAAPPQTVCPPGLATAKPSWNSPFPGAPGSSPAVGTEPFPRSPPRP